MGKNVKGLNGDRQGNTESGIVFYAELEMPIRAASGNVIWEAGYINRELQGEVRATDRNLEPSAYRWHLSHDSGCDFPARECR